MEKEVFERIKEEYTDLGDKLLKLRSFLQDESKLEKLDDLNKDLLITQLKAMETYISILSIRLGINSSSIEETENE